jgi:hypothetical protein
MGSGTRLFRKGFGEHPMGTGSTCLGQALPEGVDVVGLVRQPRVLQGVGEGQAVLEGDQVLGVRVLQALSTLRAVIPVRVPKAAGHTIVVVVPQAGPSRGGAVQGAQSQAQACHGGVTTLLKLALLAVRAGVVVRRGKEGAQIDGGVISQSGSPARRGTMVSGTWKKGPDLGHGDEQSIGCTHPIHPLPPHVVCVHTPACSPAATPQVPAPTTAGCPRQKWS